MDQYGNTTTYNIESVLYQNISSSEYYKNTCSKLNSWEELVDEIYYSVDHVEPWMSGNARGASSAFCLLFRLGQLKPDDEQVQKLLDHTDSPYIRALGFLYLRYVLNPRQIWDWLQYYIRDREEFKPSGENGTTVTIGAYARDIFLDQYYFETLFPRIPKPVGDDLAAKLTAEGMPAKAVGNAGQGGGDRRGIEEANRRPASVKASLSVAMGQRAPNRAAAREEGRGLGSSLKLSAAATSSPRRDYEPRSAANGHSDKRKDGRDSERDRARDRDQDRDRDRQRSRDRDADRRRDDRYAGGSSRDKDRGYDRHNSRDRDRERPGSRDDRRSHDRAYSKDRDRDDRGGSRYRSRSRDHGSRDTFKERSRY